MNRCVSVASYSQYALGNLTRMRLSGGLDGWGEMMTTVCYRVSYLKEMNSDIGHDIKPLRDETANTSSENQVTHHGHQALQLASVERSVVLAKEWPRDI